jgi:hypothetical protein
VIPFSAKRLGVLGHAGLFEPIPNLLHRSFAPVGPDDGDKEFLVSGLRLDEEGRHGRPHSVPGRLGHLDAGSPTPRASPAAPSARWSQCAAWHGSEVVPPGSSLVEIDLIEQPDGTLPAPDPHRPTGRCVPWRQQ